MFSYVYRKPYQIHTLKQTFEKHVNTLLTACKNNSHYVSIIDFNRFIAKKQSLMVKIIGFWLQ